MISGEFPQPNKEKASAVEAMTKRIEADVARMWNETPEDDDIAKKIKYLTERLALRGQDLFSSHAEEYAQLIGKLRTYPYSNPEAVPKELGSLISQFLVENYTPEDLEEKIRVNTAERYGWTTVNEAFAYNIDGNNIAIHVPAMFTKTTMEMMRLFKEGLRTLAQRLVEDQSLANIEKIVGESWIIYEYPLVIKKMGFEIEEIYKKEQKGTASITRENFVAKYL